jgi:hypothetical protein
MLITLKNKFQLFRHSEVLRLRRELRRERAERALERQQLVDAALVARGGKPAFGEPTPHKDPDVTGLYTPKGHPSRRGPMVVPPQDEPLSGDDKGALDRFKKEAQG